MNDTSRELGGALGVAVLGSLVSSRFGSRIGSAVAGLDAAQRSEAKRSLAGALQVASDLGDRGRGLVVDAQQAFLSGFHLVAVTGATATIIAAIVAWRLLPQRRVVPTIEAEAVMFEDVVAPLG
jgi:hypothetical protein